MSNTARNAVPRALRWVLPSVSQCLWLAFVLAVLLSAGWRAAMIGSDGDACMHRRVGEWMLQHRQILRADIFSHTRYGEPVIPKEWLAQIVFAVAGRLGGWYGMCLVAALAIATAFALLHRQLLREGNDILVATLIVLLAAWPASSHWVARPHVFSFPLLVLWHGVLRRFETDRRALSVVLKLGVLTVLWVNVHGAFLAGAIVLGLYWAGAAFERDRQKLAALTVAGLVCAAASLLNPSGYKLVLHNIGFLRSEFLTGWIAEYGSTNFQSRGALGFLAWLALMFFTVALRRPRLCPAEGIVLLAWTYFALYAARNLPLLVLLTAPIVARPLSQAVRGRWAEISARVRLLDGASRAWPVVGALAAAIVLVPRPTALAEKDWPVRALEHVRAHPGRFAGPVFNQYVWGGYLMWEVPELKVFVDGRTDFYGESLIREFHATVALQTNWTAALEKYQVRWTLMPTGHRLNQALSLWPVWQLEYSDAVATIFRRVDEQQ